MHQDITTDFCTAVMDADKSAVSKVCHPNSISSRCMLGASVRVPIKKAPNGFREHRLRFVLDLVVLCLQSGGTECL
jgi:hypothetical protein